MQKFNILYGKEITLDDKINNSFFLYHTIYTNHSNESINPISFSNNTYYSAVLYYLETDSFSLELYQNLINSKTQEIKFRLKNKIKLNPSSLEYVSNSEDVIKMYFISEKYLLIENMISDLDTVKSRDRSSEIHAASDIRDTAHRFVCGLIARCRRGVLRKCEIESSASRR